MVKMSAVFVVSVVASITFLLFYDSLESLGYLLSFRLDEILFHGVVIVVFS